MTTATNAKSATSTANLKKVSKNSSKKDAKKGNARDLQKVILEYRDDKVTASKVVSTFRRDAGQTIYSTCENDSQKVAAIQQSAEFAKAQLIAAIDRDVQRALTLVSIPRGTTGKGGLHHSDVTTEIFTSMAKKTAIANNTKALQSAGVIS